MSDALVAVGLGRPVPFPIAGENRLAYRNRLRMKVIEGRATLFNRSKLDGCPALRPELWKSIVKLIDITSNDPQLFGGVEHLEVRVGDSSAAVGLSLACVNPRSFQPSLLEDGFGNSWRVSGKASQSQHVLSYDLTPQLTIDVPLNAFVQVNSEVNQLVVRHVSDEVERLGARSFIDLFCGAGNLSLPLAVAGLSGVAVERSSSAIATLAARSDTPRLAVLAAEAEATYGHLEPADVLLVNPPRRGVANGYEAIAGLVKRSLIIVSCDPVTLASDLARFALLGLEIDRLVTFDMFPGTEHVETVVTLIKR